MVGVGTTLNALAQQNQELSHIMWTIAFGLLKAFPWWFYLILLFATVLPVINAIIQNQRTNVKTRGKSELYMFFENIYFLIFQRSKIIESKIENIDKMGGNEFEWYLYFLFKRIGYKVKHVGTKESDHCGDFGTDLVIEKDGIKTAIQAKRYSSLVGIDAVRQIFGGKSYYKTQKAAVITNNFFTVDAKIQAQASGVELWNRDKLIETILLAKR